MKGYMLVFSLMLFFAGCGRRASDRSMETDSITAVIVDTLIGREVVTGEFAGSAYRKRAVGYFLIMKGDTSDLMIVFSESNEGAVGVSFNSEIQGMSYREKLLELRAVLREAKNEFNLDSLDAIFLGRLMSHGDIAIDVTAEFQNKRGTNAAFDNRSASAFMMESKLARDFDAILKKYSLRVTGFSLEKCHLTNGMQLPRYSKIEKDSAEIPDQVVDCLTWVKIGRANEKAELKR